MVTDFLFLFVSVCFYSFFLLMSLFVCNFFEIVFLICFDSKKKNCNPFKVVIIIITIHCYKKIKSSKIIKKDENKIFVRSKKKKKTFDLHCPFSPVQSLTVVKNNEGNNRSKSL